MQIRDQVAEPVYSEDDARPGSFSRLLDFVKGEAKVILNQLAEAGWSDSTDQGGPSSAREAAEASTMCRGSGRE